MSLFITELAFSGAAAATLTDEAKIGIFLGSTIAGLGGWFLLKSAGGDTPETGPSDTGNSATAEPVAADAPIGAPAD